MISAGWFPLGVTEVHVPVEGVPPPASLMAKFRLAASESVVAAFLGFLLAFPVFAAFIIIFAAVEDAFQRVQD